MRATSEHQGFRPSKLEQQRDNLRQQLRAFLTDQLPQLSKNLAFRQQLIESADHDPKVRNFLLYLPIRFENYRASMASEHVAVRTPLATQTPGHQIWAVTINLDFSQEYAPLKFPLTHTRADVLIELIKLFAQQALGLETVNVNNKTYYFKYATKLRKFTYEVEFSFTPRNLATSSDDSDV